MYLPGTAAAEGALLAALARVGVIPDDHAANPSKIGLSRASRTDRGVHALGNVISLRARIPDAWIEPTRHIPQLVKALNADLPSHIRVYSAVMAPRSFSARRDATSRVYHYFLPVSALTREKDASPEASIRAFQGVIAQYIGTHPFHNMTSPSVRATVVSPKGSDNISTRPAFADPKRHPLWTATGMLPNGQMLRAAEGPPAAAIDAGEADSQEEPEAQSSTSGPAVPKDLRPLPSIAFDNSIFTKLAGAILDAKLADGSQLSRDQAHAFHRPSAWRFDPAAYRTVYHAKVSGPSVVRDMAAAGSGELLQASGAGLERFTIGPVPVSAPPPPPGDAWHLRAYTGVAEKARMVPSSTADPANALVCVTLHASGFMYNQIRHMLGLALAVHHGRLPNNYIQVALTLPFLHPLPKAPPFGLLQGEVHWSSQSFMTLQQPDGTPEDSVPIVGISERRAHVDEHDVVDAVSAAAQSPDIALLTRSSVAARQQHFETAILPDLLAFAGTRNATAARVAISPVSYTFSEWMAMLQSFLPPAELVAQASRWYELAAPHAAAAAAAKEQNDAESRTTWARSLWEREGKEAPLHLQRPVYLQDDTTRTVETAELLRMRMPRYGAPVSADILDACRSLNTANVPHRLARARLAEIAKLLLPGGLSTAISVRTGVTRQRDVQDITRAVTWRISRGEWPPVASAAQHAQWVAATGVQLLVREGLFVAILERAEARDAVARMQYEKRAQRRGETPRAQPHAPLMPLEELYDEGKRKVVSSDGAT